MPLNVIITRQLPILAFDHKRYAVIQNALTIKNTVALADSKDII